MDQLLLGAHKRSLSVPASASILLMLLLLLLLLLELHLRLSATSLGLSPLRESSASPRLCLSASDLPKASIANNFASRREWRFAHRPSNRQEDVMPRFP